jgi:IMP dehydrogenase
LLVGAAVGAGPNEFKRAQAIIKEGVDLIVVDTAHGHTKKVGEIIKFIKKFKNQKIALCAGNIATPEAAKFLIKLGVDIIKGWNRPWFNLHHKISCWNWCSSIECNFICKKWIKK